MKKIKQLWSPELDVAANLRRRLPKLARKYFNRGQHALGSNRGWDAIHKFRLETKRFRYTLELFRSEYGPGLEQRIDELRHVQTLLGDANDCVMTAALLEPLPDTEGLRSQLSDKADSKLKKLRLWWRANLGSPESEERWISYLKRFAGKPMAAN